MLKTILLQRKLPKTHLHQPTAAAATINNLKILSSHTNRVKIVILILVLLINISNSMSINNNKAKISHTDHRIREILMNQIANKDKIMEGLIFNSLVSLDYSLVVLVWVDSEWISAGFILEVTITTTTIMCKAGEGIWCGCLLGCSYCSSSILFYLKSLDGQILHRVINLIVVIHKIHNRIKEVPVVAVEIEIVVKLMTVDRDSIKNQQGTRMRHKITMIIRMSSLTLNSMTCTAISYKSYLSLYSWV